VTRRFQPDLASADAVAPDTPAALPPEMVRRLIDSLDSQLDLLGARSDELDALNESICANDNDRMEQVLAEMALSRQRQGLADRDFKEVRDDLAGHLGWQSGKTRLERLLGLVGEPERRVLAQRRRQVAELAQTLRRKHRQTTVLLAECVRINRLLIDCLLGQDQQVTVYGATGAQHWRGCGSLMDTER